MRPCFGAFSADAIKPGSRRGHNSYALLRITAAARNFGMENSAGDKQALMAACMWAVVVMCLFVPVATLAETGGSTQSQPDAAGLAGQSASPLYGRNGEKTSNSFQTKPETSSRKQIGRIMIPASGDNAAYIAFDQGQYLTARRIAEQRAKQNDPQAHTLLGRIYAEGLGVPRNELTAAQWYRKGAELGDTEAMFALGVILASGKDVEKSSEDAAQMFEQAARKGHAFAHYNLAQMFLSGDGKPENPFRASQHLEYAARNGISEAQYDLATLYQRGHGVAADAYKAAYWLRQAADKGLPAAQFEYAVALLRGHGLNQDKPKIVDYLTAAANAGVAGAQNRLAHVYHNGIPGTVRSPLLAAKWHWLANQNGIKDDALDATIAKYPKDILREAEISARAQQAQALLGVQAQ